MMLCPSSSLAIVLFFVVLVRRVSDLRIKCNVRRTRMAHGHPSNQPAVGPQGLRQCEEERGWAGERAASGESTRQALKMTVDVCCNALRPSSCGVGAQRAAGSWSGARGARTRSKKREAVICGRWALAPPRPARWASLALAAPHMNSTCPVAGSAGEATTVGRRAASWRQRTPTADFLLGGGLGRTLSFEGADWAIPPFLADVGYCAARHGFVGADSRTDPSAQWTLTVRRGRGREGRGEGTPVLDQWTCLARDLPINPLLSPAGRFVLVWLAGWLGQSKTRFYLSCLAKKKRFFLKDMSFPRHARTHTHTNHAVDLLPLFSVPFFFCVPDHVDTYVNVIRSKHKIKCR